MPATHSPTRTWGWFIGSLFIKPHELLNRLVEVSHSSGGHGRGVLLGSPCGQPPPCLASWRAQRAAAELPAHPELATAFTAILREWTETCSYDFRDERTMTPLRDLTMVGRGPALSCGPGASARAVTVALPFLPWRRRRRDPGQMCAQASEEAKALVTELQRALFSKVRHRGCAAWQNRPPLAQLAGRGAGGS